MRVVQLFVAVLLAGGAASLAAQEPAAPADGAQIFGLVCAMCHSVNPPPKAAPPISHAVAYYLRKHESADSALAALVAYLRKPEAERSVMPPMAIERFGLMPSQGHLSDAQLLAVARYALSLADSAHVAGGHHPQMR
jgi:mono/diheme cytochrome c family protein